MKIQEKTKSHKRVSQFIFMCSGKDEVAMEKLEISHPLATVPFWQVNNLEDPLAWHSGKKKRKEHEKAEQFLNCSMYCGIRKPQIQGGKE